MDLIEACENGNEERVVELLVLDVSSSRAAKLCARGLAGRTALLAACMGGQACVVRLLLGERCVVHFTSRSEVEVRELLKPLKQMFASLGPSDELFIVSMVTKDGGCDVVPKAEVQLPLQWTIPPKDLLDGTLHVDDFGNTPLQCVSCFGCGSNVQHIDNGLDMTKQLLIHGDLPNLPKKSNKWTPLHWGAYNGNHEQIAMFLDPVLHAGDGSQRFAKTQFAIPLLVDIDHLFPVDLAGRRGLALRDEKVPWNQQFFSKEDEARNREYRLWRLRLDHVQVIRLFIREFLAHSVNLTRYVAEMNGRNLQDAEKYRVQFVTAQDVVRYGQHLLYWAGCFGLVDEVRSLLQLKLQMPRRSGGGSVKPLVTQSFENEKVWLSLRILYSCSCEFGKKQSVLHAVAAHGRVEILKLFFEKLLHEQLYARKDRKSTKDLKPKQNAVIPARMSTELIGSTKSSVKQESVQWLNSIELINAGWINYRNETPLFHAVLNIKDEAVRLFTSILSLESIAWELDNVNVEGSLLHHIASESSRRILGIEHQPARPEYVMIFDGEEKKYFKESVIETLHEESALAPSLVVTRSGFRGTVTSGRGRFDYLVVGVSNDVLIQEAQALQLKVKHRGSSTRSIYNARSSELYESFRSLQRQQVILSIIQRKINLRKHIDDGNIKLIFPLHDAMGCRNIVRQWSYTDSDKRIFQPFAGNSLEQFFLERKRHQYEMLWPLVTYFGEKHAFYYAFVTFYTVWLVPIAVIGFLCQMLWLVNDVRCVPPLFAIIVSIWATLLVERWKRKHSEIQRKFGHYRRNRSEETPEFYGDFRVEMTRIQAKSAVNISFPRAFQLVRIYAGIPVLLAMAVAAVVIFVAVKSNIASSTVLIKIIPWFPPELVPYVVPLLNAILMLVLDNWYTRLARFLTVWENHRTVWAFESMLATKLFSFKFLNAFISLFWIAFVDQDATALRKQLLIVMGVRQLWISIERDVVPMLHVRYRWKSAGFRFRSISSVPRKKHFWSISSHEWYNAELSHSADKVEHDSPPLKIFVQELMYPPDFLMDKQMEVVLQFGYVTMFVSVLPAAPLFALLSNVVAMRLDILSCTQAKRRPPFESETEVSTLMSILEFMSFAAVAVNCAVLFFTTRSDFESLLEVVRPSWRKKENTSTSSNVDVTELWLLLFIEHVVLGTKALMALIIEDSASWVRLDEDEADEKEKEEMLGVPTPCQSSVARGLSEEQQVMPHRKEEDQSKFNQALAKQYVAALLERDEAIKREQRARELLAETIKHATKADMKSTTPSSNNIVLTDSEPCDPELRRAPRSVLKNKIPYTQPSSRSELKRRQCFLCFALRNLQTPSEKRCISCHIALCSACDEIIHLDDLGLKEPLHCRVKIPEGMSWRVTESNQLSELNGVEPDRNTNARSRHSAQRRSKLDKKVWRELRRHVETFIVQSDVACIQQQLTSDEAFKRCSGHISIALRYLRNHERQRIYCNTSDRIVSSARALSKDCLSS